MRVLLLVAALMVVTPAIAKTTAPAHPASPEPISKEGKKADPNKPYVYDSARKPFPPPQPIITPNLPDR